MRVIKRDGRRVGFDSNKIRKAVEEAFRDIDGELDHYAIQKSAEIAERAEEHFKEVKSINIEEVQNFVEECLMATKRKDVAKQYILYRNQRTIDRERNSKIRKIIKEKVSAQNVQNQNANVDEHSFGGRMGEANSAVMKELALDEYVSPMARENHLNNRIYIHDLDAFVVGEHNCFFRGTRFITQDGIRSFENYNDGDVVSIIARDGKWREATVHYYGRQPMYEITLARAGVTKKVVATRNHRWLLRTGQFTDHLEVGDALYPLSPMEEFNIDTVRKAEMFALGFVLGDGYDHRGWLEVKFCTAEKETYMEIFNKAGYSLGISNGYKYARKKVPYTKKEFLSNKCWKVLSFEDKRCIFNGYLAADGSKTTVTKYLWTSNEEMCHFIEDLSALSGYHILKKSSSEKNTNYKRGVLIHQYALTTQYSNNSTWKVVDIRKGRHTNRDYEAWCLEEPVTHTFTLEGGIVTGNCLSIPFDDLLSRGFDTRQTDVRPAQSINTAFQLLAVIFQLQSLQQFGGVSATHLDWTMVPYVRKSFYKHYKEVCNIIKIIKAPSIEKPEEVSIKDKKYTGSKINLLRRYIYKAALKLTQKELDQSTEGLYHNLNTLQSRSGNQLPFTSINYGTCTLEEGRMVTKSLLDSLLKGVGKFNRTSIFPCGIFQCMNKVNRKKGDPNYDLFRLALKCTAIRLYPNYANCDWSGNAGYDINDPKTYFSTMGALRGQEHLTVKLGDENPIDISIKDLFAYCKTNKLQNYKKTQIWYNKEKLNKKPLGKRYQEKSGLPNLPGVYSITYLPQDVTYIGSSSSISRRCAEHKCEIGKTGGIDAGLTFGDTNTANYEFKVLELTENYKEAESLYIQKDANINPKGLNKKYYKHVTQKNKHRIYDRPLFKFDLSKKQELIDLSELDVKVLDIDNKWTKVKHIFRNDRLNTPYMMHIFYREYDKEYCLSCTEDHPLWTGKKFTRADQLKIGDKIYRADNLELDITDICWHWEAVDSYDIGTETGTFIGSDIIMHNCRTANGFDINADPGVNPQTKDGRGNICPVTIIMPTLAMEARAKCEENSSLDLIDTFMSILDKAIEDARDMLIERFEWICSQSPESAKFMYDNGLMLGYKPEEGIRSALKHGTLALGQLGLAETLEILIGCNQIDPKGMELAKKIEQKFKDRCSEYKQEFHYVEPTRDQIKTEMKLLAEKKLGRDLTQEEVKQIENYKN